MQSSKNRQKPATNSSPKYLSSKPAKSAPQTKLKQPTKAVNINLNAITIETMDRQKLRPSILDINNN